jgi:hypothetical protein
MRQERVTGGWRRMAVGGAVALVGLTALAACGGSSDDAASVPTTAPSEGSGGVTGESAGGGIGDGALLVADPTRAIIYTARLTVAVDDVPAATRQALTIVEQAGGLLFDQDSTLGDDPATTLVVKVPPDALGPTLDSLAGLGEAASRSQQAQDVTAEMVDIDSRVATLEASVARLRGFLDVAETAEELATIESELSIRESELESLQAQQRQLAAQVQLATITVELREPQATDVVEGIPGIGDALAAGVRTLWAAVRVAGVALAFSVPFLAVAAVVVAGVLALVRHRRRRAPQPPAGPLPPPPAG